MLDVAKRNFLFAGYPETSLDDIAWESGIAKKTIYGSFSGKQGYSASYYNRSAVVVDRRTPGHRHRIKAPRVRALGGGASSARCKYPHGNESNCIDCCRSSPRCFSDLNDGPVRQAAKIRSALYVAGPSSPYRGAA